MIRVVVHRDPRWTDEDKILRILGRLGTEEPLRVRQDDGSADILAREQPDIVLVFLTVGTVPVVRRAEGMGIPYLIVRPESTLEEIWARL